MKLNHFRKAIICCALIGAPSMVFSAVTWTGKTVGQLISSHDGADCIYFTLEGVAEADPVAPGFAWFALPRAQYGAKDAYAMLLSAKLSGQTVSVVTRNTLSCGYATAGQVMMQ